MVHQYWFLFRMSYGALQWLQVVVDIVVQIKDFSIVLCIEQERKREIEQGLILCPGGKWWWIVQGGRYVRSRADETAVVSSVAVSSRRGSSLFPISLLSPFLFYFRLRPRTSSIVSTRIMHFEESNTYWNRYIYSEFNLQDFAENQRFYYELSHFATCNNVKIIFTSITSEFTDNSYSCEITSALNTTDFKKTRFLFTRIENSESLRTTNLRRNKSFKIHGVNFAESICTNNIWCN